MKIIEPKITKDIDLATKKVGNFIIKNHHYYDVNERILCFSDKETGYVVFFTLHKMPKGGEFVKEPWVI